MTKNEKLFAKLKKRFSFIFNDQYISELLEHHFDKNGCFIAFVIGLLENRIDKKKILNHFKINKDEWSELFCLIYKDQQIIDVYKKIEINPVVSFDTITKSFDCFDKFIDLLIEFLKKHEIETKIEDQKLKKLFKFVFGYILYNSLDCKLPYELNEILLDPEYENKYSIILNNTKLFSLAKQKIVDVCDDKINEVIVLLLGMNKALSYDN